MHVSSFFKFRRLTLRLGVMLLALCISYQLYRTVWERNVVYRTRGDPGGTRKTVVDRQFTEKVSTLTDLEVVTLNLTSNKDQTLRTLLRLNSEQRIRNSDKFRFRLDSDAVVILIQVHSRLEDLKVMVESMKSMRFINESLVIFSHDFFSRDIFQVVHSIDFCPVLQLFYPFSIQFYNRRFPGDDPRDCPRDIGKDKASTTGCINHLFPDKYGHYREGKFAQIKHHWLWKMYFTFNKVAALSNLSGIVLRLDDDYYLAEDTVHVIRVLNKVRLTKYPATLMYILGEHEKLKPYTYVDEASNAVLVNWFTGIGRGMALTKGFWETFKSCSKSFCTFDDYNWDWSLEHTVSACFKDLKVLKPKAGRIFHIGTCHGFHRNMDNCDMKSVQTDVEEVLRTNQNKLYPTMFTVAEGMGKTRDVKGFGGWGDPRDHKLCEMFLHSSNISQGALASINDYLSTQRQESS